MAQLFVYIKILKFHKRSSFNSAIISEILLIRLFIRFNVFSSTCKMQGAWEGAVTRRLRPHSFAFSRADILNRRGVCGGRDRDGYVPGRTNGKRDAEMIPFPRESLRFTKRDLSGARLRWWMQRQRQRPVATCCGCTDGGGGGRCKDVVNVR